MFYNTISALKRCYVLTDAFHIIMTICLAIATYLTEIRKSSMFFRIFESPWIFTIHIRLSFALLNMDHFLIRKVKLDASTVPANIQEEETSEKGSGEEKSARENQAGEPVSEAGTSTEQQDKLTNAEPMKTSKQKQVNVFQKLPSVKGANRKLVRCSVCYRNIETAKIYAPKERCQVYAKSLEWSPEQEFWITTCSQKCTWSV